MSKIIFLTKNQNQLLKKYLVDIKVRLVSMAYSADFLGPFGLLVHKMETFCNWFDSI